MEGALDLFAMAAALNGDEEDLEVKLGDDKLEQYLRDDHVEGLDVIMEDEIGVEEFMERFERRNLPVVIQGCERDWPMNRWTEESLVEDFGDLEFALHTGQKFSLREYLTYAHGRGEVDNPPLYLFEDLSIIPKEELRKQEILDAYSVPKFFKNDLFNLVTPLGDANRPRFRWLLIGPAHSGTRIHVDPIGTSAWNTLIFGHKRWVLIPGDRLREDPKMFDKVLKKDVVVGTWFREILPQINLTKYGGIEFTQCPGQTIFVPAGWYHIVLNLDISLAVTENFASYSRVEQVIAEMREQKSSAFKTKWFAKVHELYPELDCVEYNLPLRFFENEEQRKQRRVGVWHQRDREWMDEKLAPSYEQRFLRGGKDGENAHIPRLIHLIWLGKDKIPNAQKWMKSWYKHHENKDGWKLKLWRDNDIEKLENMVTYKAYKEAANYGAKSDIARLEILYQYGGIYVDIDFECRSNFEELVQLMERSGFSFGAGLSNVNAIEVNNGLLISTPKSRVLKLLIDSISSSFFLTNTNGLMNVINHSAFLDEQDKKSLNMVSFSDTIEKTGPGFLTKTLIENWQKFEKDVIIFPMELFYPISNTTKGAQNDLNLPSWCMAVHRWACTWQK